MLSKSEIEGDEGVIVISLFRKIKDFKPV
jgi:hypothetical protein